MTKSRRDNSVLPLKYGIVGVRYGPRRVYLELVRGFMLATSLFAHGTIVAVPSEGLRGLDGLRVDLSVGRSSCLRVWVSGSEGLGLRPLV